MASSKSAKIIAGLFYDQKHLSEQLAGPTGTDPITRYNFFIDTLKVNDSGCKIYTRGLGSSFIFGHKDLGILGSVATETKISSQEFTYTDEFDTGTYYNQMQGSGDQLTMTLAGSDVYADAADFDKGTYYSTNSTNDKIEVTAASGVGSEYFVGNATNAAYIWQTKLRARFSASGTNIDPAYNFRAPATGSITQFQYNIANASSDAQLKLKVAREVNSSTFDYVGQSQAVNVTTGGIQTVTIDEPINVLSGDMVGIQMLTGSFETTRPSTASTYAYTAYAGDWTAGQKTMWWLSGYYVPIRAKVEIAGSGYGVGSWIGDTLAYDQPWSGLTWDKTTPDSSTATISIVYSDNSWNPTFSGLTVASTDLTALPASDIKVRVDLDGAGGNSTPDADNIIVKQYTAGKWESPTIAASTGSFWSGLTWSRTVPTDTKDQISIKYTDGSFDPNYSGLTTTSIGLDQINGSSDIKVLVEMWGYNDSVPIADDVIVTWSGGQAGKLQPYLGDSRTVKTQVGPTNLVI